MFSKLLQLDTESVTPARAAAVFNAEVSRLVREQGLSLDAAWAQVRETEPNLFARITAESPKAPVPQEQPLDTSPGNKIFLATLLKLPLDVDNGLLKCAFRGNGSQTASFNPQRVFLNVQSYVAQTRNWSAEAAKSWMVDNLPDLCQAAGQMPVIQKGAVGC